MDHIGNEKDLNMSKRKDSQESIIERSRSLIWMEDFDYVRQHVASVIHSRMKTYWEKCIYYAEKNNQIETVQWLKNRGARDTPSV